MMLPNRVSSMTTVSRPRTLSALWPAAVIARKYGFLLSALEKWPDDADRLAAVIVRGVDSRKRDRRLSPRPPRRRRASAETSRRRAAP